VDWAHIMSICADIALGGMAYRLVRSLEKTQIQQTAILAELSKRVERLEAREVARVGFIPAHES
jgi:hypothetical protein